MTFSPAGIEDITPTWLEERLRGSLTLSDGCRLTSLSCEPHSNQGALSQVIRVALDWSCGGLHGEPQRLVAKIPSAFESVRAFSARNNFYSNEVHWYRDFGKDPGIPAPEAYDAQEGGTPEEFHILMEDMWPSVPADPTKLEIAELGVDLIARFHAAWWESDAVLSNTWLTGVELERDRSWIFENESQLHRAAEECRRRFGEGYHDYVYRAAQKTADALPQIRERTQTRPRTLLHGDLTIRQFFVPSPSGGRVAIGDWQLASAGMGAEDLAQLLWSYSGEQVPEKRRTTEERLVGRYHDGLLTEGVRDYSLADLWLDFRWSLWRPVWAQAIGFGSVDELQIEAIRARSAARGVPDPLVASISRLAATLQDHDYLSLFEV